VNGYFKIEGGGIKKYQVKAGEKVTAFKKDALFDEVFDASWGKRGSAPLIFYLLTSKGHRAIQMMQTELFYTFYGIVWSPFLT